MLRSENDVVFVGDARNVVACWFICQQMCRLLKAVRLNWRKQQGAWGSRAELDETAHRYTQQLAERIMDNGFLSAGMNRTFTGFIVMPKILCMGHALR
ncbi:hypothetical protein [Salmonella enterica]|uniref:hypothetical protein n=1 Tax=Salmonella enterica TaxID=28901 RepID=UPI0020165F72|nr:hypothetical protein [Salmonella enterica]